MKKQIIFTLPNETARDRKIIEEIKSELYDFCGYAFTTPNGLSETRVIGQCELSGNDDNPDNIEDWRLGELILYQDHYVKCKESGEEYSKHNAIAVDMEIDRRLR